ncbi:hypothetical protein [Georgenia subflava]|uniref:Uncharacterized protein n=1 Tax=Georgenia subflava TaxID=1622177 RepID=A0A6N7EFH0_9MICO|nr:hypothetical protein [Georgenia subflava]MPV35445.1 hypothetical protein [Georgenia subflava]
MTDPEPSAGELAAEAKQEADAAEKDYAESAGPTYPTPKQAAAADPDAPAGEDEWSDGDVTTDPAGSAPTP